eukprot:COSAG02_NODE_2358_length_9064_cov_12.658003_5_plen_48_part_00
MSTAVVSLNVNAATLVYRATARAFLFKGLTSVQGESIENSRGSADDV